MTRTPNNPSVIKQAREILFRYFVGNRAAILSIKRSGLADVSFTRTRCGNADGFFWGRWQVSWRRPYSKVWAFDPAQFRWVPAYEMAKEQQP